MKKILFILALTMTTLSMVYSQSGTIDSTGATQPIQSNSYTPTYTDVYEDGLTVESTSTDVDADTTQVHQFKKVQSYTFDSYDLNLDFLEIGKAASAGIFFLIFFFVLLFSLPLIIIVLALYFRNRNRRERYRLIEKAIGLTHKI